MTRNRYYSSPAELAEMIVADFRTAIGLQLPCGSSSSSLTNGTSDSVANPSPMDGEMTLHHAYAANKARFFAGREKVYPTFNFRMKLMLFFSLSFNSTSLCLKIVS